MRVKRGFCDVLIGELSERSGVSRRALRYYDEQGLLVPERGANGYREYPEHAPLVVEQLQGLYAAGLDSAAIRRFLPCARGAAPELEMCAELRAHLLARATELEAQSTVIARQRAALLDHLAERSE